MYWDPAFIGVSMVHECMSTSSILSVATVLCQLFSILFRRLVTNLDNSQLSLQRDRGIATRFQVNNNNNNNTA